jgi:hypothetical protein
LVEALRIVARKHSVAAATSAQLATLVQPRDSSAGQSTVSLGRGQTPRAPVPASPISGEPTVEERDEALAARQAQIRAKKRRLSVLEEQQAIMGFQSPPHIVTEIEDIQRDIANLEQRVREPSGADAEPSITPISQKRRIDAAVPSSAQLEQQIQLLVQARFPESPLLQIIDWPTRTKPDSIEQASDPVTLSFQRNRQTNLAEPALLEVQVVAPSFRIEGADRQLFEVPLDEFSKPIVFLLTAVRLGYALIHVEIYNHKRVCLGTLPIETTIVETLTLAPVAKVANMILGVLIESREGGVTNYAPPLAREVGGLPLAAPGAPPAPSLQSSRDVLPSADQPSSMRPAIRRAEIDSRGKSWYWARVGLALVIIIFLVAAIYLLATSGPPH